MGVALLVAVATAFVAAQPPAVPRAGETFDVRRYLVQLDLNVEAGTITGREQIEAVVQERTAAIVLDSGALTIDSVKSGGSAMPFRQAAQRLIVTLPVPARAGDQRRLDIAYHGAPRTGLTLLAKSAQAYTTFSTSQWMPAVNAPEDRATLDLEVSMPAGWRATGSGREVERKESDDREAEWRVEQIEIKSDIDQEQEVHDVEVIKEDWQRQQP